MKLTLEPTELIAHLQDRYGASFDARIWQGEDEHGVPVHCFIVRVAVHNDQPPEVHQRFAAALQECAPARPELRAIPLRLII